MGRVVPAAWRAAPTAGPALQHRDQDGCHCVTVPGTGLSPGWGQHRQDRGAVSTTEGLAVFLLGVQLAFPVR